MTRNLKAVPSRDYGCLESVSDELIDTMRTEMELELLALHEDLRELGKKRNGLERIEIELRLRGYG